MSGRKEAWTRERLLLLEHCYGSTPKAALLDDLNALSGARISLTAMFHKASELALTSKPKRKPVEASSTASKWTAERLLLMEDFSAASKAGLLATLNALPGAPITMMALLGKAGSLGLVDNNRHRLAPPKAPPPLPPGTELEPVPCDAETVREWAGANGLRQRPLTIAAVNVHRLSYGLPPFSIERRF